MDVKAERLKSLLSNMGSVAVAFSAGVDSTLLLAVAHEALGDSAVAITAVSPANPKRETNAASSFCAERGIRQVAFDVNELEIDGFERNPPDRCYRCKRHLFGRITELAAEEGLAYVVEGSNTDDMSDYRPGNRALEELGIRSPLKECAFSKADVRELSQRLGLPTASKQSFACLYTRFPYGELLTPEKLRRVDEAEQYLLDLGLSTVRVRVSGEDGATARIEVAPDDIATLAMSPMRERLVERMKGIGFTYVSLDLQGYRTGSMNETL